MAYKHVGDTLLLCWKAKKSNCTIELQGMNIEVVVRAFDTNTEALSFCEDETETSEAQLVSLRLM